MPLQRLGPRGFKGSQISVTERNKQSRYETRNDIDIQVETA